MEANPTRSLLPQSRCPKLEALFRLGEALYDSRLDLQQAFPSGSRRELWYWLMWHGATEYPEVLANLYPLPDRFLRERVVGENMAAELFHRSGLVDWRRIEQCLRDGGYDWSCPGSVLDFGCGCARILRFFGIYADSTAFCGADVDRQAVEWCQENIDFPDFAQLDFEPPSPFPAETFNGIFSFSVFSHLSESRHLQWLEELRRISAPGAVLVVTTQGETVLRLILDGQRGTVFPPTEQLAPAVEAIRARGFGFFPYGSLDFKEATNKRAFDRWDLASYGSAFILEPYVRERWTRFFELVTYLPSPDSWQDFVILRRGPDS